MAIDLKEERETAPLLLGSDILENVRFGRNRLLAGAGATLTAVAARMWFPDVSMAAPPNGCQGWNRCSSCSGATCTSSGCKKQTCCCPPGGVADQCWQTCAYEGSTLYRFKCCDWRTSAGVNCICRGFVGPC